MQEIKDRLQKLLAEAQDEYEPYSQAMGWEWSEGSYLKGQADAFEEVLELLKEGA